MENRSGQARQTPGEVARASMIGSVLEWYDFYLYGFVAALVFGRLFFPTVSDLSGTLASFGTLAVGFVARPLGGVIFGHFGDRIGRKAMLVTTITIMGIATALMGVLPTYDQIGVWAPILLTVFRFLQGVALGGEWGGAVLMAVEYAPRNQRGYFSSIVQIGAPLGLALGAGTLFAFSYLLSPEAFLSWGWRVPFLLSILLLIIGLWIRLAIDETPAFKSAQRAGAIVKFPIFEVFRRHSKIILCTTMVYLGAITVPFYTAWIFMVYYATSVLKIDRSSILLGVVALNVVLCAAIVGGGIVSDRFGRRTAVGIGVALLTLGAFPVFAIADLAEAKWVWLAMFVLGGPVWFAWGGLPAYFSEMFPEEVRYTGISLGSQAATIIGGLVPLYATAAVAQHGTWPISALIIVCELLAVFAFFLVRPSHQAQTQDERIAQEITSGTQTPKTASDVVLDAPGY